MASISPGQPINAADILDVVTIKSTTAATIQVSPNGNQIMFVNVKAYSTSNAGGSRTIQLLYGATVVDQVIIGNAVGFVYSLCYNATPSATTNATISINDPSNAIAYPVITIVFIRTL